MSKITKFAQDKVCTARIPGVCNFNKETSVWAHIRSVRFGAGVGKKPSDLLGLIACSNCHDVIDGRVNSEHSKRDIEVMMYEGHCESLLLLELNGLVETK